MSEACLPRLLTSAEIMQAFNAVQNPPGEQHPPNNGRGGMRPPVQSSEDVGFFDPDVEDSSGKNAFIIAVGLHNYYRDVFSFTDRLKDLEKGSSGPRVKEHISGCIKGGALRWSSGDITALEKDLPKIRQNAACLRAGYMTSC